MLDGFAGGQSEALSLAVFPSHLQLKLMAAFASQPVFRDHGAFVSQDGGDLICCLSPMPRWQPPANCQSYLL